MIVGENARTVSETDMEEERFAEDDRGDGVDDKG